ncbi:MAG: amidohydrolase [Nitrososphaerota archaeon]
MRLILRNCRAYTSFSPPRVCSTVEIEDGVITSVGVEAYDHGGYHVLDLGGKTVLPAFTDCHIHLTELALQSDILNLRGIGSKHMILDAVSAARDRQFIYGVGWEQDKLDSIPIAEELEKASGGKPVLLERICGHVGLASMSALRLLGPNLNDSRLVDRDAHGRPIGLVREEALESLRRLVPSPPPDHITRRLIETQKLLLSYGLTRLHVIVMNRIHLEALEAMAASGAFEMDILCYVTPDMLDIVGKLHPSIRIAGVKVFVDGSLGARTAALRAQYHDGSGQGILRHGRDYITEILSICHERGVQAAFHAIGDEAIFTVLDAVESYGGFGGVRIEHASVMDDEMIGRAARLGVVLSVQPMFAVSDTWLADRLGDRVWMCYRWKSMLSAGCLVCGGSDAPVEDPNPLLGVWSAVAGHRNVSERLDRGQALQLYTSSAARATQDENRRGSIGVGQTADLVVLDRDPFLTEADSLKNIRVVMTIRRGQVVYGG